jgi:hypothetical protein
MSHGMVRLRLGALLGALAGFAGGRHGRAGGRRIETAYAS